MLIKPVNITINGQPHRVWTDKITYTELLDMAGIEMSDEWMAEHGDQLIPISEGSTVVVTKS